MRKQTDFRDLRPGHHTKLSTPNLQNWIYPKAAVRHKGSVMHPRTEVYRGEWILSILWEGQYNYGQKVN